MFFFHLLREIVGSIAEGLNLVLLSPPKSTVFGYNKTNQKKWNQETVTFLHLAPRPRQWVFWEGHFNFQEALDIHLAEPSLYALAQQAREILNSVNLNGGELHAGSPNPENGLCLQLNPFLHCSGAYRLSIQTQRIEIEGQDQAGIFYALKTLQQILQQQSHPPCMEILDWPDFPHRGIMLDISRDKVPTQEQLYRLVELMSRLKYNQLQLYTEHTFAYRGHETVWQQASPMTGEEILALDAFCRERFIELVPNQNSFGHMTRWLKHPGYTPLAEVGPEGFEHPLSGKHVYEPFSLCPGDEGSLYLLEDLYNQLLPHFTSQQFNIGCDETFDLGQGRSRELCANRGKGVIYLDFFKRIQALVRQHGRVPQFWGDIILNHPHLLSELPRPCIALNWGYEAEHPFMSEGEKFQQAGIPHYVCPGTSAWNSLTGRSSNMRENLKRAAEAGLKYHATGFLLTDWGDNGHWQTWPVSLPGYLLGAAYAWAFESNQELSKESELAQCLDWHVLNFPGSGLGHLLLENGRIHELSEIEIPNRTLLFQLLHEREEQPGTGKSKGLTQEALQRMQKRLLELAEALTAIDTQNAEQEQLLQETQLSLRFVQHALSLGRARLDAFLSHAEAQPIEALPQAQREELARALEELLKDYRQLWLQRNRPGGLSDSVQSLERLRAQYRAPEENAQREAVESQSS